MPEQSSVLPIADLRDSGLLWLINRVVFHPYGLALGLGYLDDGQFAGWYLLGDGSEPMQFAPEDEQDLYTKATATLNAARHLV